MSTVPGELPRGGDIIYITRKASVQFVTPMAFRVIRCHKWPTYEGWVWLDGYQLNNRGEAVLRRSIFVQIAGILPLPEDARSQMLNCAPRVPRPTSRSPHRQRTTPEAHETAADRHR